MRSLYEIARICDGRVVNCSNEVYVGKIVNNDKLCEENCCYLSLDGKRSRGNSFVSSAIKNGARAVISNEVPSEYIPTVIVPDAVKAARLLAEHYRKEELDTVIAVTGSVGKTTVKELCSAILSERYSVLKTEANKNNLLGVPLTVLSGNGERVAVIEAGISEKGEMEAHSRVLCPDIAIITSVGMMHAETLGSVEEIAREKLRIIESSSDKVTLIIPENEPLLKNNSALRCITVGLCSDTSSVSVTNISFTEKGSFFDVRLADGKVIKRLFVPIIGTAACLDAGFAIAAATLLDVTEEEIRAGLLRYKTVGERQNIFEKNGVTVISDCYNCGPSSAVSALETLGVLSAMKGGKSVAVFGSMLELGKYSESEHISIGKRIAHSGISELITVGDLAQNISLGALICGMEPTRVFSFTDTERQAAGERIRLSCERGATVLLKGSRGMRLEEFLPYIDNK